MKKKIAVYANGYNFEAFQQALVGIKKYAKAEDFDIFVFMCFASYGESANHNKGELNIYHLGPMEDYDGIIVFSNHLNSPQTAKDLCYEAKSKNVPVVSIGMPIDGIPGVRFSNKEGMRDLITHLVEVHGVKRIVFVGGPKDHIDCAERLEVVKEVLAEHGLTLKEEDTIFGDWGNTAPRMQINRFVENHDFPDALVCANDTMAMAANMQLLRAGYSVPEDLIITGFDNITFGRHSYPALTSVDTNLTEIGYQSCKLLFDQLRKTMASPNIIVPSVFANAESCGCTEMPEYVKIRKEFCKHYYQQYLETTAIDLFERILIQQISSANGYESLKRELQSHFNGNHIFEGNEFYIMGDPDFFENMIANAKDYIFHYRESEDVIVALKDGKSIYPEDPHSAVHKVSRHELIPEYEKTEGRQQVYYLFPLHHQQFNYGYVIFTEESSIMNQNVANPYLEKLQEALKMLCINLRLNRLNQDLIRVYNRDPMTGLYNRLAYEEKAEELYQQSLRNRTRMMVMFVDINYMKRINDQFGHLHGDNAIKTVAESIKSVLKKDWIAVRFGGDEFLLIATDCDMDQAAQVRRDILSYLDIKNYDGSQPYTISASCGYVITNPDIPSNLQEYVKEADNLMYQIKQEVHARDGKPRY